MTVSRRNGFTMIELCLALMIGVLLILLAVPSITGMLAEQHLKASFERFDKLVAEARRKSVTEQQTYALAWEKDGVSLLPVAPNAPPGGEEKPSRLEFAKDETFQLRRPAALLPEVPAEWIFWPNGICEPAQVAFHGKAGSWLVRYDPLTSRGIFLESQIR